MLPSDRSRRRRQAAALDPASMESLALAYVARFATTRAKLEGYLARKLAERGWAGDRPADIDALVGRLAELRYVDDEAWASARAGAMRRRGYGPRRVEQALRAAGIDDAAGHARPDEDDAAGPLEAAVAFAVRRRIGPFGPALNDPAQRERQLAAMVRAGHDFALARKVVFAETVEAFDELEAARLEELAALAGSRR